ncbi:MAG TPA: TIGR02594 family protein [Thermohalobaculum sp.]|nr:TIGR02594 family protein [Thermohalobaculum sp.]
MAVKDIQKALKKAGFDPGSADGIIGRKTTAAIKAFQAANKLTPDGIVGPKTMAALFGDAPPKAKPVEIAVPTGMPWLQEAYRLIDTREVPGKGSNGAILGWAKALKINYNDDEIPWCGLFVAHCIGATMPEEALPANPLGARQWTKFGKSCKPQKGAVMVFWRGSRDGWKGHVGFYWGEDDTTFHILGGNQSNSVSVTRLTKDRLLQARWPKGAMAPSGEIRMVKANGEPISTDEA